MEKFGERLRRLRKAKNLMIEDMARSIGCAASTLRDWENGRAIQGEPYLKISEVLGVSIKELLSGEKPSTKQALDTLNQIRKSLGKLEAELLSL